MKSTVKKQTLGNVITTATSDSVGLNDNTLGYGVLLNVTVNTPSAGTFTAAASDVCTKVAHDLTTGLKVTVSNAGGDLPAGLAAVTDYFVIVIDSDTFKLASSLVNALAGTAVDITDAGTGTHTITPTAIAGGTYKVQASVDDSNWVDVAAATAITASTTVLVEKLEPMFNFVRVVYAITAGRMTVVQQIVVKTDE